MSGMRQTLFLGIAAVLLMLSVHSQADTWKPSPGHTQVPIWPGEIPDVQTAPGEEYIETPNSQLVADKPWSGILNVTQPTMTVYSPKTKNTGAAVVVFPGGGFVELAIDLEGTEICDWLTSEGITCVLLKYRVPSLPYDWHTNSRPDDLTVSIQSLEDAQRTMGLVRSHASEWHVDPHKVGVIGFSAGGYLVAEISNIFERRLYKPVDAADKESCRPDFAMGIYPGHLWNGGQDLKLNKNIPVTKNTPPTFLIQAEDDHVDDNEALVYYLALKKAGVPVEMHLFAHGGHAFGLRHTEFPITDWPKLADRWMTTIGIISK